MTIKLDLDVQTGGGWVAKSAERPQSTTSPILLVTLDRESEHRRVRLDIDKQMFIDTLPEGVLASSSVEISSRVVDAISDLMR